MAAARCAAVLVTALLAGLGAGGLRPFYQADPVDLVRVAVQVVGRDGSPVRNLGPGDFRVQIAAEPADVVLATFVDGEEDGAPRPGTDRPPGTLLPDDRTFVLALDEPGLAASAPGELGPALSRFVRQLRPRDVVGIYPFSFASTALELTRSRVIGVRLARAAGRLGSSPFDFGLTTSEIVDISAGDTQALADAVAHACAARDSSCRDAVREAAASRAVEIEADASRRLAVVAELVRGMSSLPGRKHLLLISAALPSATRVGARPDLSAPAYRLGELVAESDVLIYAIHWAASSAAIDLSRADADREANGRGLELIAGRHGAFTRIENLADAHRVFDRILEETSTHYLLGIRPAIRHRDGRPHSLRIIVARPGVTVRGKSQIVLAPR
jgi:VWFA-related protein